MSFYRNESTPESRLFWQGVERAAATARAWPDWKKAGITEKNPMITREEARAQFLRNGSDHRDYDVRYDLVTLPDGQKALKRITTKRVTPAEGVIHGELQEEEAS